MERKLAYEYDFGHGWIAESIEEIYSDYKFGAGKFHVWLVRGLLAQPAAYYVCFGWPEEGYSGRWFDWLTDAVDYCEECAR